MSSGKRKEQGKDFCPQIRKTGQKTNSNDHPLPKETAMLLYSGETEFHY